MNDRFAIRRDPRGHSIVDRLSGEVVRLAMSPQVGLSRADAEHTAALLNGHQGVVAPISGGEGHGASPE